MAGNLAPTNILDLANYVQQQGDLGRQQGTAQRFNRLAGEAYAAPAGQSRLALLGQAVQTDPTAGMALGNQLAATDKAAETDHMKKIRGAAQFALDAIKSGDPARIKGAGNAVGPYLTQLTGKQFPGLSADMLPAIYQVLAQTGGMPDQKGVVLSAGGQLRNPMTGELLADNPQSLQYHDVPMGQGKAAGVFDPSTGQLRPAAGGAQSAPPQGDPMQPYIAQANQAVQLGADPAKVQAWLMQQAQQIGAQPQGGTMGAPAPAGMGQPAMPEQQAAPAQFGVGTPKPSTADNSFTQLTPAEVAQLGLPPGTVAQRGSNGKIDVVTKPSATDARLSMQARTAKGALSGSLQQLDRLKQAAMDLKNDPGLGGVTGYRGHIPDLPGSEAARARAQLDTLKSQIGFGVLQQMREMSKTGGALGSVSDRENTMLQNNLAALSTNQSAEDFARSLDKIVNYVDDAKARMQGAYQDTYGDVAGDGQAQPQQPAAGGWSIQKVP